MDLSFYWWHVLNHRIPVLWRFHNVHHIDPDLDVSTGFRFHFGEVAMSAVFRVVQVALIGISARRLRPTNWCFKPIRFFTTAMCGCRSASNGCSTRCWSHHACTAFTTLRSKARRTRITPWFSRGGTVHRTLGLNIPQSEIVIGVPGYSTQEDRKLVNGLLMPFRKQRDYWRTPDGKAPRRGTNIGSANPMRLEE
jgi:Sterol desaturase